MGQAKGGRLVIAGIRGRDGATVSPLEIPDGLAAEVFNTDLDGTGLGAKRAGHTAPTITGAFPGAAAQLCLLVHYPSVSWADTEIWGLSSTSIARLPLTTATWSAALTAKDAPAFSGYDGRNVAGTSFNGKFVLHYNTATDRTQVWDATLAVVRRLGLAAPGAAPTVADTGAGAYAATQRWYQVSYRIKNGTLVIAEGERSASVAFTPSGGGTHARVTKPAAINESETHWVLWASETGSSGPFYQLAETAVGTTTYDDNAAPADYDNGTAAQLVGTFTTLPSTRYSLNDGGNRLLFAGAYESGIPTSRVWWTPVLGSLGRGDDERYLNTTDIKGYVDLDELDGGAITGLAGPMNGQPIVFKERQIWRLVPTADVEAPYRPICISKNVGCLHHRSIEMGEDEAGHPALYFASTNGIYRLGQSGLQFVGRDIADLWATCNTATIAVFIKYYQRDKTLWVCFEDVNPTTLRARFHVRLGRPDATGEVRGGWVRDGGTTAITAAIGMAMVAYSPTSGLTDAEESVPRPHVLLSDETILCADVGTTDNGSNYQAYVDTRPEAPWGIGVLGQVGTPVLIGKSASGTPTITVQLQKNYSAETRTAAAELSTTRSHVRCDNSGMAECHAVAFRIGDGSAQASAYTLDAMVAAWQAAGEVATL